MEIFHAIIQGIVEGISEFLPISSTGHLILSAKLLGILDTNFQRSFDIIIQLGAILAVVVLYGRKFLLDFQTLKKILAAFIPTAIIGLIFYKTIKHMLGSPAIVVWSLLIGGIFMIIFERWHKNKSASTASISEITFRQAVIIGCIQSVSMIPGVSRSAATIFGGMFLGLNRIAAVEFSFLLAVPTMMAATGLDLLKNYKSFSMENFGILGVGFLTSFVVALIAIQFLMSFIHKNDFTGFGIYRIVIALIFLLVIGV